MLIKPYNLTINLDKPTLINTIVIKKGDHKSRRLIFNIISNNECIAMDDIYSIAIKAIKPDDKVIYDDVVIENGKAYYDLIEQFTASVGEVECELEIIGTQGGVLNSPSFYLTVQDNVYDANKIISENILLGLQTYVAAAYDALREVQEIHNEFGISYGTLETVLKQLEDAKGEYVTYLATLEKKVEEGYFNGERGAQGEDGANAVVVEGTGIIGFQIVEGNLMCYYYNDEAPPLAINDDGHLIYDMEG